MISQIMVINLTHGTNNGYYAKLIPPFHSPNFGSDNYHSSYGIHSFAYFLSSDFVGSIVIQASLVAEPSPNDWSTLEDTRITITAPGVETATTKTYTGHVLWFRVEITDFTAGTIIKIQHSN